MAVTPAVAPLGIIAGRGDLPQIVVQGCLALARPCFVVGFEGDTDASVLAQVPHVVIGMESIGVGLKALKKQGVKELVMVGPVARPELTKLRPDVTTVRLVASLLKFRKTGDDALFRAVVDFLEGRGFTVRGVHEVLPEIVTPMGVMGRVKPDARAENDIHVGLEVARLIGAYDIGQAVVVQGGRVIGVEAAEGTDALLKRVKALQTDAPGGVLVKVKKPQQDMRVDLPAVGPQTILNAAAAGLRGVAIEAGHTLMLHQDRMIEEANAKGLFLYGITAH